MSNIIKEANQKIIEIKQMNNAKNLKEQNKEDFNNQNNELNNSLIEKNKELNILFIDNYKN